MKKWKCAVCGYEHLGDDRPEKCPACSVDGDNFSEVVKKTEVEEGTDNSSSQKKVGVAEKEADGDKSGKKWKCTICNYIHTGAEPPETCPVCGADSSFFVEVTDGDEGSAEDEEKIEESEGKKKDDKQKDAENAERDETRSGKEEKEKKPFGLLGALVVRLHLHPISVHIPNGLLPVAVVFLALGLYFHYMPLEMAGFFNLIVVLLSMPVVFATGYIAWQRKYRGAKTWLFKTKIACSAIVTVLVSILVFWRIIDPQIALSGSIGSWIYLAISVIIVMAAGIAGYLGSKLVFHR